MSVSSKRLAIYPSLGDGVDGLLLGQTAKYKKNSEHGYETLRIVRWYEQHLADDSGTGDLDKNDVVQTNAVEGVEKGQAALNFVGFDHRLEHVADGERLALSRKVVGDCKDSTKVVRRVAPFGSEPAVIEV